MSKAGAASEESMEMTYSVILGNVHYICSTVLYLSISPHPISEGDSFYQCQDRHTRVSLDCVEMVTRIKCIR